MNERSRELIGYIDVNPRIRELAEQCNIGKLVDTWEYEKFAELIVKECIETLGTHEDYWTHEQSMNELKKHFGVEE